jgi:plasmid rolling circle replication initiator protein Rep
MPDQHNVSQNSNGSIVAFSTKDEYISLESLSKGDQVWNKHRRNADIISNYYRQGGMDSHADRVAFCSQLLEFKIVPKTDNRQKKLKLASAKFCRVRHCPICQWRRSLQWKARAYENLPKVVADYPNGRWIFLTLTMKNCALTDLRETLTHLNKSFKRLSELKAFPGIGWVKSVEVTRGRDGRSAHPHLHCLILLKDSYYKEDYLSKSEWIALWKQSLRVDYCPVLDVKAIQAESSPVGLIAEVLKYQCKESDLVASPEWFLGYVDQVHGTRAVGVGGVLRKYFRELEEEPDDLIGHDEESTEETEGPSIYFRWNRSIKKYVMVRSASSGVVYKLPTRDFENTG